MVIKQLVKNAIDLYVIVSSVKKANIIIECFYRMFKIIF